MFVFSLPFDSLHHLGRNRTPFKLEVRCLPPVWTHRIPSTTVKGAVYSLNVVFTQHSNLSLFRNVAVFKALKKNSCLKKLLAF